MKKSIIFIVPYPYNSAPSQHLKFEQYYRDFEKAGYEVTTVPFITTAFWKIVYTKNNYLLKAASTFKAYLRRYSLLFKIRKYDIVYVHLWSTPLGVPVHEWFLSKLAKKLIYDIDDLVYKSDVSPRNKIISIFKSGSKSDFLIKHADWVLVSTERISEYVQRFNDKVSLIPATIDVNKYKHPTKQASSSVVIGWSGSHTTSKYLHILDDVLKQIAYKHNVRIVVMGDSSFKIDNLQIELLEWSSDKETEYLQRFDIGLHPVPDEEWVYGKSGGKLVQYMAAGIPIIASAVGPNFKAVIEGYNGFLVTTDAEWKNRLELLITDSALRKQMGINSRKRAEEVYSLEVNIDKYLDVFKSV